MSTRLKHTTAPMFNVFITVTGSASGVQFPNEPCLDAVFKADPNNVGTFFVGSEINQIYPFDANEETASWLDLINLNQLWHRNPSGTIDYLHIWLQR